MSCYRQIHSDKHVCCNCEMDVVHMSSIKHVHTWWENQLDNGQEEHTDSLHCTTSYKVTLLLPWVDGEREDWNIDLQTCFSCIAWDDSSHLPISWSLCTTLILTCPFSGKCCSLTVHVCCKQLIKWCTTSINIIITCSLWQQGHSE